MFVLTKMTKKVRRNADLLFLLICGKGLFSIDVKSDFEHDRDSKNFLFLFLLSVSPVKNGLILLLCNSNTNEIKPCNVWLN